MCNGEERAPCPWTPDMSQLGAFGEGPCPEAPPGGMKWPVGVDYWEPTGLGEWKFAIQRRSRLHSVG